MSPFAIWKKETGIMAAIAPRVTNIDSFLQSFPVLIARIITENENFINIINDTPQFYSPKERKFYISHKKTKNYNLRFWHTESFTAPTTYVGLEVTGTNVIGFTSSEIFALPLMY